MRALRVCERFKQGPSWWDTLPPLHREALLAYDRVRTAEEQRV
jgi:hypothetical protein